ncbi:hypothetical protein [Gayadomonas joobiniege]|uniref:hypothetical protein n=1 Tax=Gayadomonas joobiniege TaxID=1234606 RepID=UPI0003632DC6|nr:hypothetical protein [Gayadomonas joobiniege]
MDCFCSRCFLTTKGNLYLFSQTIEYSPLGYVKKQTDSLGVEQLTQRFYCSANTCPAGGYYGVRTLVTHPDTPAFGAEPVITYFNKQHQVIAKDVSVFNGDTIRQQMSYYPSGLLHKKSNSFIVGGVSESNKRWDEYDYDEQRRVKKIKYANGGEKTFSYNVINGSSIGLSEWSKLQKITQITKVIKDYEDGSPAQAQLQTKISYLNAMGQLVSVVDANGTQLNSVYNAQGLLVKSQTNGDTSTTVMVDYNNQGQRIGLTDPSLGHIAFTYTGFGELKEQIWQPNTSAEKSMHHFYDKLGRLTSREDTDSHNATTQHQWHWDQQYKGALDAIYTGVSQG